MTILLASNGFTATQRPSLPPKYFYYHIQILLRLYNCITLKWFSCNVHIFEECNDLNFREKLLFELKILLPLKAHSHLYIFLRKILRRGKCSFILLRLRKIKANSHALCVRLCVVFKPLHKIFLWGKIFARKETHVREEKEKKKKMLRNYVPIAFGWMF